MVVAGVGSERGGDWECEAAVVEACLCRQRDGVKKEDRVDELVGGGVVARRENLDETALCD